MTKPEKPIPELTAAQIDVVLSYLPMLQAPGYSPGEWSQGGYQMAYFSYDPKFDALIDALYEQGLLFSFDWMAWQPEAERYQVDPEALAQADLLTVRKLLTAHVRADRFVAGHLAGLVADGHLAAILERLQEIRQAM